MKLKDLLKGLKFDVFDKNLLEKEVQNVKIDNRQVQVGDLFIALKGEKFDGNDFSDDALKSGAVAIVSDKDVRNNNVIKVENARGAYSIISKNFFNCSCDQLKIIAVTGTNGKTTTCNTIADVLRLAGHKVGVIGTLGAKIENEVIDTGLTTPDPFALHSLFSKMKEAGDEFVVMEASAHALALNKLDGIKFEMGVLTNITEDHLDFFGTMDAYAKAKFKLFEEGRVKYGLVCSDKPYIKEFAENNQSKDIFTYGFDENCDFQGEILDKTFNGSRFICKNGGDELDIKTPLVGQYNIENALASVAVCKCLGLSDFDIKRGMASTLPVEGRFNVISRNRTNIIIDFAHTPDGLEKVLSTARELTKGKLIAIFGCGGNRDKLKRPIMGKIASDIADEVIITSDNPRWEKPMDIINQINEGTTKKCKLIENRKRAIEYALSHYHNGETIVIAGKGAEKYQEIEGVKYPYNDFDIVYNFYSHRIERESDYDDEQETNQTFDD